MKTILVATDFSEYADYAVKSAIAIANQAGSNLILLHVETISSESESKSADNDKPSAKIQKKLESIVKEYRIKNVKVLSKKNADVCKTIVKQAESLNADLIVMGAYGKNGIGKSFVGYNTERVMVQAKMPLMIIKEKFNEFNIENIVVVSEFNDGIYKVYPKMKKTLDLFRANIHLLSVNTPKQFQSTHESMKLMDKFCQKFDLKKCTQNTYNDQTIEEGVINFAKQIHADLIAVTPDGFKRLTHLFNKNITNELMKQPFKVILSMKTLKPVPNPTEFYFTDPESTTEELAKM